MKSFVLRVGVGLATTAVLAAAVLGSSTLVVLALIGVLILGGLWALGDSIIALVGETWAEHHRKDGWS